MIETKSFDSSFLPIITGLFGPILAAFQLCLIGFTAGINYIRNPPIVCYGVEENRIAESKEYYTQYCLWNSLYVGTEDQQEDVRYEYRDLRTIEIFEQVEILKKLRFLKN